MKSAAPYPLTPNPIAPDDIPRWVNAELLKLLLQLRNVVNYRGAERLDVTTGGAGAYVTVWTSPVMPTDACWHLDAELAGISIAGAAAQQAAFRLAGTFVSVAGAVSQLGTTDTLSLQRSAGTIAAQFVVNAGRTVSVQVRDDGASKMRFTAIVQTHEGLPA